MYQAPFVDLPPLPQAPYPPPPPNPPLPPDPGPPPPTDPPPQNPDQPSVLLQQWTTSGEPCISGIMNKLHSCVQTANGQTAVAVQPNCPEWWTRWWYWQASLLLQKQELASHKSHSVHTYTQYTGGGGPKYAQFLGTAPPVLRVSCSEPEPQQKEVERAPVKCGTKNGEFVSSTATANDVHGHGEFNPNRFRRKVTKNQHIYGVWAPEDDSDGDDRSKKTRGRADYTSGVSFISAGVQQPVKSEKPTEEGEGEEGVGAEIPVTDSSSEDEAVAIPKAFMKRQEKETKESQLRNTAGLRTKSTGVGAGGKAMGMFGIGAQLAMKMGWQPGKGLGKDEQGITAPIEAVVRKGRGAIGAYGREAKSKPAEIVLEETTEKKKTQSTTQKERNWRRNEVKNVEYRYVTVDEVLEQKNLIVRPDAGKLAKTKVIDLTGPETRILSGYHAISGQRRPRDDWDIDVKKDKTPSTAQKDAFDLPELTHNLNLLLETCEQDILRNDKKSRYAVDRAVTIEQEQKRLRKVIEQEEDMIHDIEKLVIRLKGLTEAPPDSLDIQTAYDAFMEIQKEHPEEWELQEIYSLVPATITPILLKYLQSSWAPFDSPGEPYPLMAQWKELLGSHHKEFNILVWEGWMPAVRRHLPTWDVKSPSTMLHLLHTWQPLLPAWIYTHILDQVVLPKITEGVEKWDPLADSVPVHSWIHPWAATLGNKLEIVYPPIRRKFASALVHWHPCDSSAKQILQPWASVFSKGSMEAFLLKNILPKLQNVMDKEFVIAVPPLPQNLEVWNGVMDWLDLIPVKQVCNLLEAFFFPKWLQFIISWLNQRPTLEDVYRWYTWWRSLFPEALMKEPTITDQLQKALQLINSSIQNPATPLDFAFIQQPHIQIPTMQPQPVHLITPEFMADALRATASVPFGFRDLVQMKCEELGLIFVPVPNRFYEGKQVYRCGNALIYIATNVIFVLDPASGLWLPTSLEQLLLHYARL